MSEVVTFIPDAGGSIVHFSIMKSLYSDKSVGQSFQIMVESHTVSAFLLMENYSCSTELMFL